MSDTSVDLLDRLPGIRPDFLGPAIAAYDQAIIDGATPQAWHLSKALFNNLCPGGDWIHEALPVHIGSVPRYELAGLPVHVVAGPHHEWKLVCDYGRYV